MTLHLLVTYNFWQTAATVEKFGSGEKLSSSSQYTHPGSKVTRKASFKAVSLCMHLPSLNLSASSGRFTRDIWEETALWPLNNSSWPLAYLQLTQRYSAYRILLLFVWMCVLYMCVHVCTCACMWRPELDLGVFALNESSFFPSFLFVTIECTG